MKRYGFWIPCVIWLLIVSGLFIYKYHSILYPVVEWKQIVDVGLMIGIPVLLFGICSFLGNSKRKTVIKYCLQIVLLSFVVLFSLIVFFLLSIIGVYSSTKSVDHYLIPDKDVILDPVVYSVFPQDLQKIQSCEYRYVRGKNWFIWDGNGWRMALLATYDTEQYELEINRLQDAGMLTAPQKYSEHIDEYPVLAYDQDGVRISVLVAKENQEIIYYAQYLDLARFNKEDILSEVMQKTP